MLRDKFCFIMLLFVRFGILLLLSRRLMQMQECTSLLIYDQERICSWEAYLYCCGELQ